jgi:hypothetical protein
MHGLSMQRVKPKFLPIQSAYPSPDSFAPHPFVEAN